MPTRINQPMDPYNTKSKISPGYVLRM